MIDQEREPSLLVVADRVHAFAPAPSPEPAEAVLIRAGRIEAVGPRDALRAMARGVAVLELPGATLTPGLVDAHIHLTEWALARREADLSIADSPEIAARTVADHAQPGDGWVRGRGWNPHRWQNAPPQREILDRWLPGRPVVLQSHDMHAVWVSTEALRRAGIDADTADPEGGRIVRDPAGRPTGLLLENAARLVLPVLPAPDSGDVGRAVLAAQAELNRWGITGVHSLPAIHVAEPDPFSVLRALLDRGELALRVLQHLPLPELDDAIRARVRSGQGDDWIRVGGVKMFLDGALGSRTAWMLEPYVGSDDAGVQVLDAGEFAHHARRAAAAGIATTVHAIGDAAVGLALDVLSDPRTPRLPAMPHRIEHLQCCPPGRFASPAIADITCSMQPGHLITDWRVADRHWGPDRSGRTYALRSLLGGGARLAFGSDAPVESADPRLGLFAAVARTDLAGGPPAGWFPGERLTVDEAFGGYTLGPAVAAGVDGGRLVPGALADIAAWHADPRTAAADELLRLRCVATIVGGRVVHS